MAIAATDLVIYGSANMPENDTATSGGAIATTTMILDMPMASAEVPKIKSASAGDTMNVTLTARNAAGAIVSETVALNGTTLVTFSSITTDRPMKLVLASAAAGIVTLYMNNGTTVIVAIPVGVTTIRRLFYDSASESAQVIRYESFWVKNNHGTLTLNNATIKITSSPDGDPANKLRIGLATGADQSVANRKTAPSAAPTWKDEGETVDLTSIAAGGTKQIWVEATLAADNAPIKDILIVQTAGSSV